MAVEDLHALKSELQQLNAELNRFKEELLTARIEELEQVFHAPVGKANLRFSGVQLLGRKPLVGTPK